KRIIPLLVLAAVLVLFVAFDVGRFLSFDALAEHQAWLLGQVEAYPVLSVASYILLYIAVVAFSLPGGLLMTVSGGLFFGAVMGAVYAVVGATIGATALFLVAKTSLGDFLMQKAGDSLQKMQKGFSDDALSYMFVLRLVPVFPFFLVNLAPAFLGVPLRTYLIATFFGIMPATFVYALAGSGIGSVLAQGQEVSFAGVLTPQVIGALLGLAALAMLPVLYKRMNRRKVQVGE
ncbi:MAG: TVP38/TMEM64 family protein, partial [Mariprofundaceae bacterium]